MHSAKGATGKKGGGGFEEKRERNIEDLAKRGGELFEAAQF